MKKITKIKATVTILLLAIIIQALPVKAGGGSITIDTKAKWDQGTEINIDSTGGQIKISDTSVTKKDISASTLTASPDTNKQRAIDGNLGTTWSGVQTGWWEIDLGSTLDFYFKDWAAQTGATPDVWGWQYSTDNANWSAVNFVDQGASHNPGDPESWAKSQALTARYIKHSVTVPPFVSFGIFEFEVYTIGSASHTSANTQLDGTNNFKSWDTFGVVDSDYNSSPAGDSATKVTYSFRTSSDGTTWNNNDWSAPIDFTNGTINLATLVTQRRYLQIKTLLTTSNVLKSPTVSSYTVNYTTGSSSNNCPGTCPGSIISYGDDYDANLCQTVHATVITGSTADYITVTSVSPTHPGHDTDTELTVVGTNLDTLAEAKLTRSGETEILGTIQSKSATQAVLIFNLQNAVNGSWDLWLKNISGNISIKNNAIEVTAN